MKTDSFHTILCNMPEPTGCDASLLTSLSIRVGAHRGKKRSERKNAAATSSPITDCIRFRRPKVSVSSLANTLKELDILQGLSSTNPRRLPSIKRKVMTAAPELDQLFRF
jgi:hypothetical protein